MGLGKTTTALVAGRLSGLPIYVVAPKSLHVAWGREANILDVRIALTISWAKIPNPPDGGFFCIFDEAQALQTYNNSRTQKALAFADKARYVVCITGTPAKNGKPSNMFGMLSAIKHPESFKKKLYDKAYRGASNLSALYTATRDSVLFRKKEDCIDLPEKIRSLRIADLTPESTITYNNAFKVFRDKWKERVNKNLIISSNEKLVMFMQLRHATSWAKLYAAEKIAEELNDNNKQAVFFVSFTDTADSLAQSISKFATVGKITGDVSQIIRQKVIDDFQSGNTRFAVCTFGAGGTGITLNSAHHVLLVDRPWTPGDALQAEDRLHRIGQKNTVMADWIQCGAVDQRIDELLLRKQGNISTIMTGNKTELPLDFDIRNNVDDIFNEIFK
jgi:SNF2 family DNA or RNA helicase